MKNKDFYAVLRNTPKYLPTFELVRVPEWFAGYGFVKGDRFYFDVSLDSFISVDTNDAYGVGPSAMKFITYTEIIAES